MKQLTILETETEKERPLNPCQLKKLWGSGRIMCSFNCAINHDCPIYYCDEHERPRFSPFDWDEALKPVDTGVKTT